MSIRLNTSGLIGFALILVVGCDSAKKADSADGNSPEVEALATAKEYQQHLNDQKWGSAAELLADPLCDVWIRKAEFEAARENDKANVPMTEDLQIILKKNGLEVFTYQEGGKPPADKPSYIDDLMKYLAEKEKEADLPPFSDGSFSDVTAAGDAATGVFKSDEGAKIFVRFAKPDGHWKIELEPTQ